MKKEISLDIKERITEDYKNGISTKKLESFYHIHSSKIKEILLEMGININLPNKGFGPREKKPKDWWNDKSHCEEIAKQCRNRREFNKKSSSAWKSSKENGWIDEFSEKYFSDRPEFSSLNSPIHCVYVYEIKETHSAYIGRTTNIKRRDNDHRSEKMNDTVYKHCKEHSILIPLPIILEKELTATESQIKENEWREKYLFTGWSILNKAATGKGSGSLGSIAIKWTYETCKTAASMCKNKEEFKKKFSRAHNVSRENKWIDEFFPFNSKKNDGCFDTLEGCKEAAKGYKTIMEIRKEYPFLYRKISKNKWTNEIKDYIGQYKPQPLIKNEKEERKYLDFNKDEYLPLSQMSQYEIDFFNTINNKAKCIIDKKSIIGKYLIIRVDKQNLIFILINVRKNGAFLHTHCNREFISYTRYCESKGYRTVQIYDTEFIYNNDIVRNKIFHFLNVDDDINKEKIYGRKCYIKEIDMTTAKDFLIKCHIQGFVSSTIYLGAYYNDSLIAVMSFKKGGIICNGWDLNRFASDYSYICCGVGGKIFDYFIKHYNPQKVTSFADKRWGIQERNLYTQIGFIKDSETAISYMYFNKNDDKTPKLIHKTNFMKSRLSKKYGFPLTMTETEIARELGYDRIWDCGLIKYVWEAKNAV